MLYINYIYSDREEKNKEEELEARWGGCNEWPGRDSLRSYPCRKYLKEVRLSEEKAF